VYQEIGYNQDRVSADQRPKEFQFDLSGGHLALDFANTISRRDSPEKTVEHLTRYCDLISFARQTNLITPQEAEALERKAQAQSRGATQVLRNAISLRETLFHTFIALVHGKPAPPEDLQFLDKAATEALLHRHIVRANGGYKWGWDEELKLERILWPIAQSAAELLTSAELQKVRECEAQHCYWLFLDNSRNHSRRWCAMNACGNREKARRHYRRQRTS
jgi:predicted RNA-binding Zn ribbon-like protein